MPTSRLSRSPLFPACCALALAGVAGGRQNLEPVRPAPTRVQLAEAPEGALQPQAAVDSRGTVHMVYLKGPARGCDVFYTCRAAVDSSWSAPLRVNTLTRSAVAAGAVRSAQLAIGKDDRLHVVWNGSREQAAGLPEGPPLYYTRSLREGPGFEPQRNLMQGSRGLDGGGSVAADGEGNVYAVWQAFGKRGRRDAERRLWVARSFDDGKRFAPEAPAFGEPTGACACCGTRAFLDRRGTLYVLYRAAFEGLDRDMLLLTSRDRGATFHGLVVDRWRLETCPMTTGAFAEGADAVVAAWETNGQVYCARIDPASGKVSRSLPAPGEGRGRKRPTVAVNALGEILMAWNEGAGSQRGGTLAWQVFDREGRPTRDAGRRAGAIPAWSLATAYVRSDGGFVIVY